MKLGLGRVHFPVSTLGRGRRCVFWVRGCHIRCPGCISRDLWQPAVSRELVEVAHLVEECRPWLEAADGVTVTGGEPFEQPGALAELLATSRHHCKGDVLVYSGHEHADLRARHAGILELIDVLISGPFDRKARQSRDLRGSDNQRISLLTPLARRLYPADIDRRPWPTTRRLDIVVRGDQVWMAGIPRPRDLRRLKLGLRAAGFTCRTSEEPL